MDNGVSAKSVGVVAPQSAQFTDPVRLKSGAVMDAYELVYETYGRLNADRSNAALSAWHTSTALERSALSRP